MKTYFLALGAVGALAIAGCETTTSSAISVDGMTYGVTETHVEDLYDGSTTTTYSIDGLGIVCESTAECKKLIHEYHQRVVLEEDPDDETRSTPADPIADSRGD